MKVISLLICHKLIFCCKYAWQRLFTTEWHLVSSSVNQGKCMILFLLRKTKTKFAIKLNRKLLIFLREKQQQLLFMLIVFMLKPFFVFDPYTTKSWENSKNLQKQVEKTLKSPTKTSWKNSKISYKNKFRKL